ncbi:hypothetical protein MHU86_7503 [Fragilaria crotonensis]|nr:hypothetical protein MHU86_7503 [Fragilaria crotonensis]
MSFLHNRPVGGEYHRDHVHAMEVLAAITPNDVLRYMNLKTFGTTEPAGDANPISARVTVSGDHGAVFIDMVGAIDVDGVAGQPALGTNVTMRNQLLGMQSGLLSLRQDNVELKTAVNRIQLNVF